MVEASWLLGMLPSGRRASVATRPPSGTALLRGPGPLLEGALGPRPSPWGPLPESLPSLTHAPPCRSSLSSLASLCSWVVPAPLTAHLEGLPRRGVPPWRHRAEALSPTSSSSRRRSPGPLCAPVGRPCCPPASAPDLEEDRAVRKRTWEGRLPGWGAECRGRVRAGRRKHLAASLLAGHLSFPERWVSAEGEEQHLLLLRSLRLPGVRGCRAGRCKPGAWAGVSGEASWWACAGGRDPASGGAGVRITAPSGPGSLGRGWWQARGPGVFQSRVPCPPLRLGGFSGIWSSPGGKSRFYGDHPPKPRTPGVLGQCRACRAVCPALLRGLGRSWVKMASGSAACCISLQRPQAPAVPRSPRQRLRDWG